MIRKFTFMLEGTVYPFDTVFTVETTEKEVLEYLKKTFGISLDKGELGFGAIGSDARTCVLQGGQTIIWFKKFRKNNAYNIGLLAHETLHATQFLFDRIGIENCEHSYEAWTYYQQWLVESFLLEYAKKRS